MSIVDGDSASGNYQSSNVAGTAALDANIPTSQQDGQLDCSVLDLQLQQFIVNGLGGSRLEGFKRTITSQVHRACYD